MTALPASISPRPSWVLVPAVLFVALVAGRIGAIGDPFFAAILIVLFAAVGFYAFLGTRLRTLFLGILIVVLAGYAFFGRGFAYFGVAPLYIGEITLAVGLGALFANGIAKRFGGLQLLLLAFIAWGVLTTAPYVGTAKFDALRDAAFWFYALFALLIWGLVTRREQFETAIRAYRIVLPFFLLAIPVIWLLTTSFRALLPSFPGAPVPIVAMKSGDIGVHLAGVAAFIVLGLYQTKGKRSRIPDGLLWTAWGVALLIVVITNRGGFLSAGVGLGALMVLRPSLKLIPILVGGGIILAAILAVDPSITVNDREFSASRVTERAASIVDRGGDRQETVNWRLDWWGQIIDYTFGGEFFWTGKGFGADLAEEDGFLGQAVGLRSPHNATMTALARMGVPGLLIWVSFHVAFGTAMLRGYITARRRGDPLFAAIIGWLLIYWGAGIVNGTFDVYWEGPQGAIWMWTVIGLGFAALELQRSEIETDRTQDGVRRPISVES